MGLWWVVDTQYALMHNWLGGLLLLWCSVCLGGAEAGVVRVQVLEDPTAALTIAEVSDGSASMPFSPMGDTLARGYTSSAFWLKVLVPAHNDLRYLRVRPPYLDYVTLYRPDPQSTSNWLVFESGDRVRLQDRGVWGVSLLFALPPADKAQTVYLRLQTQSSSLLHVDVLTLDAFERQAFHTMLLQLLLVAVMLGILIWAALDYVINRQRLVGVFLLVQIAQIGYVLAVGGYLPTLFPIDILTDQATSLLVVLTVAITLIFHRLLAAEFKPSRWALGLMDVMIAVSVISVIAVLVGELQFGLPLTSSLVLLLMPLLLWLAFSAKRNQLPGLVTLRVTYVALALVLFFVMAPIFGIWVSFDLYVWATTTQGLLTGLIMGAFLFRRSMALQLQFVDDQRSLARVQQKLLSEQQRVADQRQFLDMLAHELKTPLGVIQLTLDSVELSATQQKRLHRSLDTMSAVIDRCRLSLQLDENRLQSNVEEVDIASAVQDLTLTCKDPERIRLTIDGPTRTSTDRQLFLVIMHNLLDNALKYSPAGSEVLIDAQRCEREGQSGVCVMVHNLVTRCPTQDPEALFEKYFRGSNAMGQTGSGLGLHLSRRLADIIGGRLWAELAPQDIKLCLWIPN